MKIVPTDDSDNTDENDDYEDEEEMPEETGTPKIYDTCKRDGRSAPIRTTAEENAMQIHIGGEISVENLERRSNIRRSNQPKE